MENEELLKAKDELDSHIKDSGEEELSGVDIAENLKILKKHDDDEYSHYLDMLDPESLADAAIEMPDHMLKDVLENVSKDKIVKALEELESDDQYELLSYIDDIDEDKAKELFKNLDKEDQQDILTISKYEDNQAGAYMQTELFTARIDETLREAIDRLRDIRHNEEIENIYHLFCVDDKGVLKYEIPLSDLIIYNYSLTINEVIKIASEDKFIPKMALDTDSIDEVAMEFEEFDLNVLPIVDKNGVLLGRITTENIHDFIQEKATDQLYNLVGVDEDVELEETPLSAAKSRGIWLLVNLFTALVSASIINFFSDAIEAIVALAALMPIVASMGGNTGTQALTVTIRRLALGQIEFSDAKEVVIREVKISLVNGLVFAVVLGIIAYAWFGIYMLGIVIAMSMVINLSVAGLVGALVPLTLKRLNIDPAVASSVLLTTTTDVLGFFSFLGLAKWILL
ncbi:MAG: magnesium transporter [Campylobacter sp.]|nr:magnesium transporter [Campylobacter sp.]